MREHFLKFELNLLSGLGEDVRTSLDNESKTNIRTDKNYRTYREHPLRGVLKRLDHYIQNRSEDYQYCIDKL